VDLQRCERAAGKPLQRTVVSPVPLVYPSGQIGSRSLWAALGCSEVMLIPLQRGITNAFTAAQLATTHQPTNVAVV